MSLESLESFKTISEPIKVGVVGYGAAFNMGRQHLREMQSNGMVPTAMAEIDPARRKAATNDFPGIKTYSKVSSMLTHSDVDLIAIITPHNTHADLALQCLKAGRSVVIEKPMTITTKECDKLIAEATKQNVLLSTYHNRHWDGLILTAVDKIRSGVIGDVFRIEAHIGGYNKPGEWWRSQRSVSGGILYDWGVHVLEYALQILQPAELTEISGHATHGFWAKELPYGDDANEDEAFVTARFAGNRWLTLQVSSIDSNPKDERGILEITGTKGTYHMHFDKWVTHTHEDGVSVIREGKNQNSEGHKFYENIAAALRGEAELIITPEWARRPVHILDYGVQSAKLGHALPAKYK
jgi:scyllo-inositol 2-dehydrogenase (NADP+)